MAESVSATVVCRNVLACSLNTDSSSSLFELGVMLRGWFRVNLPVSAVYVVGFGIMVIGPLAMVGGVVIVGNATSA